MRPIRTYVRWPRRAGVDPLLAERVEEAAFLGYLPEDPARARFTAVDALDAGEQAQLVRDAVFAGLLALIDQGRQELDDPDSLTPATAESVGGGIFRQIRLAIEREGTANLDALVPGLMFSLAPPTLTG